MQIIFFILMSKRIVLFSAACYNESCEGKLGYLLTRFGKSIGGLTYTQKRREDDDSHKHKNTSAKYKSITRNDFFLCLPCSGRLMHFSQVE